MTTEEAWHQARMLLALPDATETRTAFFQGAHHALDVLGGLEEEDAERAALALTDELTAFVKAEPSQPTAPVLTERHQQPPALSFPDEITDPLREVLGLMVFTTAPLAHAFRDAGHDIPRKAEAEQAFVLHWLLKLALQHGAEWRKFAAAEVERLTEMRRERVAAAKGDAA